MPVILTFTKMFLSSKNIIPARHSEIYGQIGESYALNEFRAIFKMGGHPIANRLADKNHNWADSSKTCAEYDFGEFDGLSVFMP